MFPWLRKLGALLCMAAIFFAGGGHWFVLQSVAWGRMLVDYSRTRTLSAAVKNTFDGDHPCPLCLKIRAAKQQEKRDPQPLPWSKPAKGPELLCQAAPADLPPVPAQRQPHRPTLALAPPTFTDPPPTPPPQAIVPA